MGRAPFGAFSTVALAAIVLQIPAAGAARTFKVIVHPEVEGSQIPRQILSSIFLREVARWGSGLPVKPVDQSMRSPVRAAFTEQVLDKPVEGIPSYWHAKIKKGVAPPPVRSTDADVISYVASTKGAIGYVSLGTTVPDTVKTLSVVD